MFATAIQIVFSTGCALALCLFVGWGLARLGLPVALREYTAPVAPLCGFALVIWAGYLGVSSVFSLRQTLPALLLIAAGLNLLAWRRGGPPHALSALRGHAILLAILALTLLAGILPLLQYGYLTTIGRGWDPESYLPMAQYLVDYPLARIGEAAQSPLRDLVRDPPRIGLTLGFSILQGFTMIMSGQSALETFAPLLALLRALGVLATYLWLRTAMGLERPAALLAAALTSAGSLMLWIAFFNFGMQISSWPLIGLGLTLGLAAIDELAKHGWRSWPSILLAGICLAALPVAYYPALTIFLPVAAGLGLARICETVSSNHTYPQGGSAISFVLRLLAAALALGTLTALLAAPTIVDYYEGFAFRYSLVAEKIGPDRFIPLTDMLGLTPFRLERGGDQPPDLLFWAAAAIGLFLAGAGFTLGIPRVSDQTHTPIYRLRWLLALAPLAAYLAWLRFGRPYEYAYMKSSAYAGAVLWGLLLFGWQRLIQWTPERVRRLVTYLPIPLLAAAIWSQALILAEHGRSPALFGRDLTDLARPVEQIAPDAAVLISADERFVGPNNGLFATLLYPRPIWGRVSTAYYAQSFWPEGNTPGYALLAADEPPWPLDLGADEIWRSRAAALYRFAPQSSIVLGRADIYGSDTPTDPFSPAALAVWRRSGPNATALPGQPLTLLVGDDLRIGDGQPAGQPGQRVIRLTIACLAGRQVTLRTSLGDQSFQLSAGVSTITLQLATPTTLRIEADGPLALIHALMQQATANPAPQTRLLEERLAWAAEAEQRGELIEIGLRTANPGRHALRAELIVIEDTFDEPRRLARTLAAVPIDHEWRLRYAPGRGAIEALVGDTPTPLLQADLRPDVPDGFYFAVLTLYSGEEPIARAPLFRAQLSGGQITGFQRFAGGFESAAAGPPAHVTINQRAILQSPLGLGSRPASLAQIILARRPAAPGTPFDVPFAPGDQLLAQLYWSAADQDAQPLAISLQVLGPDDRKIAQWDGPAGGEWRQAAGWQAGDQIRQDVPLSLDPSAPAGNYRLLLVAYDPASGAPQPIAGQQALLLGEITIR